MARLLGSIAILSTVLLGSGCRSLWPSIFNPGSIEVQRSNASLHDPYTDPDLGPTDPGGRPRDFQKPRPEPVRNQPFRNPHVPPY